MEDKKRGMGNKTKKTFVIQRFIIVSKYNFSTSWLRGYTYFLISAGNASNSITSNSGPFSSSSWAQITKSPWKCLASGLGSMIIYISDLHGNRRKWKSIQTIFFPSFSFSPLCVGERFIHSFPIASMLITIITAEIDIADGGLPYGRMNAHPAGERREWFVPPLIQNMAICWQM